MPFIYKKWPPLFSLEPQPLKSIRLCLPPGGTNEVGLAEWPTQTRQAGIEFFILFYFFCCFRQHFP